MTATNRRERKLARRYVRQPAHMVHPDGSPIGSCTMVDVSAGGARLKVTSGSEVPDRFVLLLSSFGQRVPRPCVVAWRGGADIGVRFVLG